MLLVLVDEKLLVAVEVDETTMPPAVLVAADSLLVTVVTLFASRLLISADGLVVVDEIVPDWFIMVVVPVTCWGGCGG